MQLTDHFIQRPVLATVISLFILLFGLRALFELPLRQFPKTESAVIQISTTYPGANAQLIQGFITDPIQKALASAEGLDYIASESRTGLSVVSAHIRLNYDTQKAFTNIMSKVAEVRSNLPADSDDPVVSKKSEQGSALMYLGFTSPQMNAQQITDYVQRVVTPKIETLDGVAEAQILGGSTFAMRIWIRPEKLASYNLSMTDVTQALQTNNFQTAAGSTEGEFFAQSVRADTDLSQSAAFGNIVIKQTDAGEVKLSNIAKIELGARNYDSAVSFNGKKAVFIGINATPTANPLTVISRVRNQLPNIEQDLPPGLQIKIAYDATKFIRSSIWEVAQTIIEATLIVILVIYCFLGSSKSVLIPVVTIPLSLIGVCAFMLALGYSINLLTLLAMVLAIGLVVDDAIVVVENIHRRIEQGELPFHAALAGTREIAMPIISMTLTLAAVYAPIGFMGGITGALFVEFAFTLAASVIISGIIALTLTPVMCAKLLKPVDNNSRFADFIDRKFETVKQFYHQRLTKTLSYRPIMLLIAITVLLMIPYLYLNTQKETAPQEDTGFYILFGQAPEYATFDYMQKYAVEYQNILANAQGVEDYFIIEGMGSPTSTLGGLILKPWNQRNINLKTYQQDLQNQVNNIAGIQTYVGMPSPLPGSGDGTPFQMVITALQDYQALQPIVEKITDKARRSGLFIFAANTLKFNKPEVTLNINREKAASLGISMTTIGQTLGTALSGAEANRFELGGKSYKVIPQLTRQSRGDAEQLMSLYIPTARGKMVPLSTIATLTKTAVPDKLDQFQQLNSATINGVLRPGVSLGDAINYMQKAAQAELPNGMGYDFKGQSRQFIQEGASLLIALMFSLIIIYLVLAAQFESFRDPFIILWGFPMSLCGALIPLNLGAGTINIYTGIGLITLIGLISKHGILMVEFANTLQTQGRTINQAILEAASVRLRPIIMTTAAMVFGVLPLVFASGAGAQSRVAIGIVITSGMVVGTLFTLFVIPVLYSYLARSRLVQAS